MSRKSEHEYRKHHQRNHLRRRAAQRMGFTLNRTTRAAIVSCIKRGDAEVLQQQPQMRRTLFRVWFEHGRWTGWLKVVFDHRTLELVTVMPDRRMVG